jgi:hypothetical protein
MHLTSTPTPRRPEGVKPDRCAAGSVPRRRALALHDFDPCAIAGAAADIDLVGGNHLSELAVFPSVSRQEHVPGNRLMTTLDDVQFVGVICAPAWVPAPTLDELRRVAFAAVINR